MSTRVEAQIKTIQAMLLTLESDFSSDAHTLLKAELETIEETADGSSFEQTHSLLANQVRLQQEVEKWQLLAQQAANNQRCKHCHKEVNEVKQLLHSVDAKNAELKGEIEHLTSLVAVKDHALSNLNKQNTRISHSLDHWKRRYSKLQQQLLRHCRTDSSSEAFRVIQSHADLAQQLGLMLVELAPPEAFAEGSPSPSDILTYFSNLLTQYMELKVSVDGQTVSRLSRLLGVGPSRLVHRIEELVIC